VSCSCLVVSRFRAALPAAVICLAVVCSNAYAKDQVPDWVRAAAAQKTPDLPKDTDAVFLLEETTYSVAADGSRTEHVRRVVRVLRPQGRKYGRMFAGFSGNSKLRYMHIWSIGPDGKEYAVKDNELTEEGSGEGFELYSDERARGGRAPAMDVGAVAAVEYERMEKQPYENDIIWIPGEDGPVVKETLSLNLPPGFTFTSAWKGKPKAEAIDREHGQTLWEADNQPALVSTERVPLAPPDISRAPRMDIFYQGPGVGGAYGAMNPDWQGIGLWFERLAKDRNKPDPAITAKAQELVQGKTGFRERVEAISNFVQGNIRYVAIEIGVGGFQPHAAADTFRVRYGDCKDKATLLSAMLAAVGVRSTWVLVDTHRGMMSSEAPSMAGNHMIAAIELPKDYLPQSMYSIVTAKSGKRFLIFDPTWEKTPFGHLERELQGSDALLVDGADSQVIRLPVLAPQQNLVERKASFQLAIDGALAGTVQEQDTGDIARSYRYLFANGTGKEQQDTLDHSLSHDMAAFSMTDLKVENANDLARALTVSYTLKADHFAQEMGPLLTVRPRVLGREALAVDNRKRELPIDLGETRQIHDDFTIALPTGFTVDELPPPVKLDVGFAAYQSETKVENNTLHYSRTYTVREIVLPANRYPDVQKLARTINGDEQSSAVLKRAQ
jgi:hypothetical protein